MNPLTVTQEAARCLLCHNPPCSAHCPSDCHPGEALRSLRFDNLAAARSMALACVLCGECEARCVRAKLDAPIEIVSLMTHLKAGAP